MRKGSTMTAGDWAAIIIMIWAASATAYYITQEIDRRRK